MPDGDLERLESLKRKIAERMAQEPESSLNPCLTEEQVSGFERDYLAGGRLPEGYRLFLLEVGNGGFRPGADFPPDCDEQPPGPMESLPLWAEECWDMDRWHPERPFPMTEGITANDDEDPPDGYYDDGTLFLCNWGCGMSTLLVVTGEEKGHVWFVDPTRRSALPELRPDGTRLDFLDWYDLWLDGRDECHEMNHLIEA